MDTYQQIANLFHRYADYIDEGKLEAVSQLLKDCTIADGDGNVLATGYEEVLAMYSGMIRIYPETNTPQTQHVLSNLIVEEQEQENVIHASENFSVFQKLDSGSVEAIICGKYKNIFHRTEGVWSFHRHTMTPRIIGDMSQHITFTL